ncbi:glycosyl hydrolase 115 family protein [Hymenobacter sp. BT770]|uniref:glycosyl hydrolase 115 family protein n=1 Tax=Hymenobacter sp. BT770 TaxID=2886942 RepID=UPI001D0FC891|nr:glycosyl hydrolase 115 family protein [Hymenobacter sp. BT770]MCC3154951.1 glycosyl hydrolase 115 family protein [Hymenobacter sp. BT770]MDO3416847.1 glycosyl hydrolase 115 family protein [Hymenobacter sp. BT770]
MFQRSTIFNFLALVLLALAACPCHAQGPLTAPLTSAYAAQAFPLVHAHQAAPLYYDAKDAEVVRVAAEAFAGDVARVTGVRPSLRISAKLPNGPAVIIGTLGKSRLIDQLVASGKLKPGPLRGQWESYAISVIEKPFPGVPRALVITGSDRRGTAFGVFEVARRMGVSPWVWWADVVPAHHAALYVQPGRLVQGPPSVQYRGIFLNDEDWGLRPWAARHLDKDVHDIGPNTYAHIFELLLRLKANYIWPAMHPGTKAFYHYPADPVLANRYAIVVGSSHCEPMLRNNVFEWAENYEYEYGQKPGEWRYDLNGPQMHRYWEDRLKQSARYESVYTVGMRGIHDGSMPGPPDRAAKVRLLDSIITDQRSLLRAYVKPINGRPVPQIFCPYKEVLTLYQSGLKLPDDVTIVWADDNHGYIRQLSNQEEQKRSGGSGVYYHLSYWGAPQDYLWLSSISPPLVSYELSKAYALGARRLWVVNVGDIKPAELETEFALDLAWNVGRWTPATAAQYPLHWATETFGTKLAPAIAHIKQEYYRLAQAAKPEHLSGVTFTAVEADKRLADYQKIATEAQKLQQQVPATLQDAYFELVLYPTQGARLMNEKVIYAARSLELAKQGDNRALVLAQRAQAAYDQIQALTHRYNNEIAGGKWAGMMSSHPRDQKVFEMPPVATAALVAEGKAAQKTTVTQVAAGPAPLLIAAAAYTGKKEANNEHLTLLPGLGLEGNGLTRQPYDVPSFATVVANAPYLEYRADLTAGPHTVTVRCLPTFGLYTGRGLRYAVSVNNSPPQIVDVNVPADSKQWKENVLRGFSQGQTPHEVAASGPATIRLYLLDPGVVVNQLQIQ